jgi:hypothetical protein
MMCAEGCDCGVKEVVINGVAWTVNGKDVLAKVYERSLGRMKRRLKLLKRKAKK